MNAKCFDLTWDHVHIRTTDVEKTAEWFRQHLFQEAARFYHEAEETGPAEHDTAAVCRVAVDVACRRHLRHWQSRPAGPFRGRDRWPLRRRCIGHAHRAVREHQSHDDDGQGAGRGIPAPLDAVVHRL